MVVFESIVCVCACAFHLLVISCLYLANYLLLCCFAIGTRLTSLVESLKRMCILKQVFIATEGRLALYLVNTVLLLQFRQHVIQEPKLVLILTTNKQRESSLSSYGCYSPFIP
eukprot:m.132866 g.132866  ORF g.132866 m.132866 type:complete len:113 (+) comp13094_c1_seq3:1249-1587(+)